MKSFMAHPKPDDESIRRGVAMGHAHVVAPQRNTAGSAEFTAESFVLKCHVNRDWFGPNYATDVTTYICSEVAHALASPSTAVVYR